MIIPKRLAPTHTNRIYSNIYIKRKNNNNFIIITVYIDDCIIITNKILLIQ
uniref:Uncharacterized protein n=1 Tax=Physcomitrium patens TaxID=3218 RepID=A0A2K1KT14_PHYPA|nr:hypothetical protein PHYPA_003911 [Physcomitrium patens]